jgi:hypothetical protein
MSDTNFFWREAPLGDVERICLLSMARQNYKVRLFSYDPISNSLGGSEGVLQQ